MSELTVAVRPCLVAIQVSARNKVVQFRSDGSFYTVGIYKRSIA